MTTLRISDDTSGQAMFCGPISSSIPPPDTSPTPPDPPSIFFDDLVILAARICCASIAFVSLADQGGHQLTSAIGVAEGLTIDRSCPLLNEAMTSPEVLVVPDAALEPRFAESPLTTPELGVRFYAGVPLLSAPGQAFGTLSVADRAPHDLTQAQRRALTTLATQIVTQIELRLHIGALRAAAEERELTDEARAQTEASLQSFFDGTSRMVGIVELVGDDVRYVDSNRAADLFFFDDADGAPLPELASERGVPPDVLELWLEAYRECQRKRGPIRFEYTHPHASGPRWLSVVVSPLPAKPGAPPRCSFVVEDATARQRVVEELRTSAERLKLALDSAQEGLWDLDVLSGAMDLSDRSLAILGYEPGEIEPTAAGWGALVHPDDAPLLSDAFTQHYAGRTAFAEIEARMLAKDGTWRWMLTAGKIVLCDAGGAPLRITGTHRDVTDRRKIAAEYERARDQADDANRTKSMFLASMSHELRTPLNVVLGYAELLEDDAMAAGATSWLTDLARIRKLARHLLGLINDILDLSRIEADKLTLHPTVFDVADLARDVAAAAQPLMDRRSHRFTLSLGDDLGRLKTDAGRLRQCLMNLLDNAAKFTDAGAVSLKVERCSGEEAASYWARFTVTDTGVGMSPEQVSGLFNSVFREGHSWSRKYGGTGLGVALTQRLCGMMGAALDVQSELGKGTSFALRIPATMPPMHASDPAFAVHVRASR